jgi:tetratricopeptide (TPR) repeat protein
MKHSVLILFCLLASLSSYTQQSKIDSLFLALQATKTDTIRVKLLYNIADEFLFTKPVKAIEYAKLGIALSEKNGFIKGQSICLNALGRAYLNIGKLDTALSCFEKRYEIVKELKDSIEIARVYINMGIIFSHFGDYKKAIGLYKKANRISTAYNEKSLLAKGYINIGAVYQHQAEYSLALEYYLKTCKIYEDEKNERDIGMPLMNISIIYSYLKQYDKAKQYALEAKTKFEKANNLEGVGEVLQVLSSIYSREGNIENMIKYLKEAKAIFEETQTIFYQAIVNQGLGAAYLELRENEKALGYFNTALPIAQKVGDNRLISVLFGNIGEAYSYMGDFPKALEYTRKSEKILKKINDKQSLLETLTNFIEIFSRINQPDSVKKYLMKYKQLSDTIYNEQNNKSIAEMQAKYESEKKDKEILALTLDAQKKKNTIFVILSGIVVLVIVLLFGFRNFRNKKKKEQAVLLRMVSENDMKALRLQMNPHFIFNCIHTIHGLLDNLKIQESKKCLDKFSTLTRLVLENSKKREIPLSDELKTLRLYMDLENMRFASPFKYLFKIEPSINPETTLVPPLILQPFVENSIKHGFRNPEKIGQLKIEIRTENEFLVCSVEDNGVGRANTVNIKSISGFKKESLGIKLTEERLELISKTKKVESYFSIKDLIDGNNNSAGTLVEMYLPFELSV